jgi:hypothetical protein
MSLMPTWASNSPSLPLVHNVVNKQITEGARMPRSDEALDAAKMADAAAKFMRLGFQYYTAARSAVLAGLIPVCGNLCHHAVEMLLKGCLSQTHSLEELREFGHNLCRLWNAFKAEFPATELNQFDDTIATLDRFEHIRYPDAIIEEGAVFYIQWVPAPVSSTCAPGIKKPTPSYPIVVPDIDRLVARILEFGSVTPQGLTVPMNEYAREAIRRNNPACDALFPSQAAPPPLTRPSPS